MGTGFGEGGVCTPGGVQKIFQGGILLVDPGVILPKIITLGVPSGPPGAPPAFDRGMCWVILGFRGGVHPGPPHPPHPSPVPTYVSNIALFYTYFVPFLDPLVLEFLS